MNQTRKGRRFLIAALLLLLTALPSWMPAFAASRKAVKAQSFSAKTGVIEKKALTVKRGNTKLLIKKNSGYLKFQAPKTKRYSFTFSDLNDPDSRAAYVEATIPIASDARITCYARLKTRGGFSDTLWLCGRDEDFSSHEDLLSRPLPSRSGKIRLKKGDILYLFVRGSGRFTVNLRIS